MTQIKTVLTDVTRTPDLEVVCFRFQQLRQHYSDAMIQGVYLSRDLSPDVSVLRIGNSIDYCSTNSEVLRMHLQNMHNAYSNAIINQALEIIFPKQTKVG